MKSLSNSFISQLRVMIAYHDLIRNHVKPVSRWYFKKFRKAQELVVKKLKGKRQLEVAFLLTIPGMWKSDEVFKSMLQNGHYHPYVVIYPYAIYKGFDVEEVRRTLERTKLFVEQKGYECIIPYNEKKKKWMRLDEFTKPDIIFFSTPYKESYPKYYVDHFKDVFTCYIPYGFSPLRLFKTNYDLFFHNLVGAYFVETNFHQKMSMITARNKGINTLVTGYPATEIFLRKDYEPKDLWKSYNSPMRKVIFAPHHSIDHKEYPSMFLEVCDEMLVLAEKYCDSIQFVFKPHQVLKFKLQQLWGVEKTEKYYQKWDKLENAQLVSDGYVDLFLTSDAMIHDCGSFTTEYLFVRKPVMYLCSETDMTRKFNEFGINSFNCHYHGRTKEDIERFLKDVVLEGKDPLKPARDQFFEDYLKPKDGLLPSQKIIQVLEEMINS